MNFILCSSKTVPGTLGCTGSSLGEKTGVWVEKRVSDVRSGCLRRDKKFIWYE